MASSNYYVPRNYHAERLLQPHFSIHPNEARTVEESYDDFKRILILAGTFFFILIVLIMSKLQIGTEEVLRWSPVVWLFGVIIAGLLMNLICYLHRKYKERKRRRRNNAEVRLPTIEQALLYSLPIPSSFPCLAPPPHIDCCRDHRFQALPSYDEAVRAKTQEDQPPPYDTAIAIIHQRESPPPFHV